MTRARNRIRVGAPAVLLAYYAECSRGNWRRYVRAKHARLAAIGRRAFNREDDGFLLNYNDADTKTRATVAAFVDPRAPGNGGTGAYAWDFVGGSEAANLLANDVMRIFADGAILIEGARTNRLLENRDPIDSTVQWGNPNFGTYTGTADDELGPDGASTGDRIEVSGVSFSRGQAPAGLTDPHTLSAYGRAKSGTSIWAANYPAAAAWVIAAQTTVFARRTRSVAAAGGSPYFPCDSSIPSGSPQDMIVDLHQLENGAFASSPIIVGVAAATRNRDEESFAAAPASITDGKFRVDYWPTHDSGSDFHGTEVIFKAGATPARSFLVLKTSTATASIITYRSATSAAIDSAAFTFVFGDKITCEVDHRNIVRIFINDILEDTIDISAATDRWESGALYVGQDEAGASPAFSVIGRPVPA